MKFSTALGLLATAIAAQAAQYPDVVMLSSCTYTGISYPFTYVDWYPALVASKSAQPGGAVGGSSRAPMTPDGQSYIADFPGNQFTLDYADGNQLTVDIFAGSNSLAFGQYGGYAWNHYHTFYCYRDNGRVVWSSTYAGLTETCKADYYCMLERRGEGKKKIKMWRSRKIEAL
ncbi:hypothetical protein HDU98_002944 [Podochytrium sp. JEL0797]|nr:hypothetical protein HDU98_002944 [Podochytrium sp. JEL0797]